MKKILLIISSLSLTPVPIMSMVSCDQKKQDFISATIDSNLLSLLFTNNNEYTNVFPINFDYLSYHNKSWAEEGYDGIINTLKITNPLITNADYDPLPESDKDFINKINKYFSLPDGDNDFANLTGLTLNIENTFINKLSFSTDYKSLNVNTTCAITLAKGWNSFAKLVVVVNLDNDYYSTYTSLKLVNYFIQKTASSIKINEGVDSENNKCFYLTGWYDRDVDNFEKNFNNIIKDIYSTTTLSDFNFKLSDDKKYFTLNDVKYYIES